MDSSLAQVRYIGLWFGYRQQRCAEGEGNVSHSRVTYADFRIEPLF